MHFGTKMRARASDVLRRNERLSRREASGKSRAGVASNVGVTSGNLIPGRKENQRSGGTYPLSYQPPVIQSTLLLPLVILFLRERIPEPQRLVPGTSDNCLSIRAHRQVQNTIRVSGEGGNHV